MKPAAALAALIVVAVPAMAGAQGPFPKPDRPVASIVSPRWSDDADRDRVDESGQIARALNLKAGMQVADIGAGSGYHTFRLAQVVGPKGQIYAEDIVPRYLQALRQDVTRMKATNVTVIEGTSDNPRLPAGKLDAAIMVHMYHEIDQPYALLWNLAPAFKAGGRLAIVDQDAPTFDHGTPPALLKCELEAVGYRQVDIIHLRNDSAYLALFEPPALKDLPEPSRIRACKG